MFDALYYGVRFLIVSTVLSLLTWVFAAGLTQSELITGVLIAVVNAFVLFATVDRFVDAKLERHTSDAA